MQLHFAHESPACTIRLPAKAGAIFKAIISARTIFIFFSKVSKGATCAAPATQVRLVTVCGAHIATARCEVVGSVAGSERRACIALTRYKVVRGLGDGGADRSGDDDEGCDCLDDGFHGISLWIGCKHDCLHGYRRNPTGNVRAYLRPPGDNRTNSTSSSPSR